MPRSQRNWDQDADAGFLRLRQRLRGLPQGQVDEPAEIIRLLQACWNLFEGSEEELTTMKKLWRAESVAWHPPVLSFTVARHGKDPSGAATETLHDWEVDIDTQSATLAARRPR